MDPRFPVTREEFYSLQMEVKDVHYAQSNYAERLLRLEKRHAEDSALKSVWNSPFPGIIGGTPQQDPIHVPHRGVFDDLDEQGDQLLGSLHLGPAEEEPVRRGGAASRANSVRFDESALQGSGWGGQVSRQSGDFGPIRPESGPNMERSFSLKSDGRHSSAGHSVHSHHSCHSGRASSLGLENNYVSGDDDDASPLIIPPAPVSLYILGNVPSIVRCWLTTNYAHDTLLYADVCTGSQKSTVDYGLLKDLDLLDEVERNVDGTYRIRLSVYLAEAVVTQRNSSHASSDGSVPSMSVSFEVTGWELSEQRGERKMIRIFVGSDALRAHSADILLSRNKMVLYGSERDRLQVPFVRPEDDHVFRHICTANIASEKPKLNAKALPFVLREGSTMNGVKSDDDAVTSRPENIDTDQTLLPNGPPTEPEKAAASEDTPGGASASDTNGREAPETQAGGKNGEASTSEVPRREPSTTSGIWGSWRQGAGSAADGSQREGGPLSGYQPAARGGRSMKVLRPVKPSSTSARTGASYEPPTSSKTSESRRKNQGLTGADSGGGGGAAGGGGGGGGTGGANGAGRLELKRTGSFGPEAKKAASNREGRTSSSTPRSANPVGGGSAFSWMAPPGKGP